MEGLEHRGSLYIAEVVKFQYNMANLFSEEDKNALAKSVWMQGASPDMFNKELVDGKWQMYIKGGNGSKIFGPSTMSKPASIQDQSAQLAQVVQGRTQADIYASMAQRQQSSDEISQRIWANTGLLDSIQGVRAQALDIQKKMLGDQSAIFSANADPRVKAAAYQNMIGGYADRLKQLNEMETAYKSELQELTKFETNKIEKENERNKMVLQWMKDEQDRQDKDRRFALDEKKMAFDEKQFADSSARGWASLNKPDKVTDPWTGETTYEWPVFKWGSWQSSTWYWKNASFLWGRVKWDYGADYVGKEWFEVIAPYNATVLWGWSHKDYGSYIDVMTEHGKMRFSHLTPEQVLQYKWGEKISAGQLIANQKNTGTVMAQPWNWVLDVTSWDKNGKVRSGADTDALLKSAWVQSSQWQWFDPVATREALLVSGRTQWGITKEDSPLIFQEAKAKNLPIEEVNKMIQTASAARNASKETKEETIKRMIDEKMAGGEYDPEKLAQEILQKYPLDFKAQKWESSIKQVMDVIGNYDPETIRTRRMKQYTEELSSTNTWDSTVQWDWDVTIKIWWKDETMKISEYVKDVLLSPESKISAKDAIKILVDSKQIKLDWNNAEWRSWYEFIDDIDGIIEWFWWEESFDNALKEYIKEKESTSKK